MSRTGYMAISGARYILYKHVDKSVSTNRLSTPKDRAII